MKRGVCFVVYGKNAGMAMERSVAALLDSNPGLPYHVMHAEYPGFSAPQQARHSKVTLLDWSPFEYTAYLDADTLPYHSLRAGFEVVESGWDLAIAFSAAQGEQVLWHLGEPDRELTIATLQHTPLQLQAGVFFVARNERTQLFFDAWLDEWLCFQDQDQGALLRALSKVPLKVWLLGRPWNGGSVIGHDFGAVRGKR